jgi:predicted alpha-1,2-mannosidase
MIHFYQRAFAFLFFIFSVFFTSAQKNLSAFVNPFIGTDAHGHTYPGATLPHGMVQLSPDTRLEGWDGCSGYHYSDNFIFGFTHTHLSGTGCSDYGDILLMPGNGQVSFNNKEYGSLFNHQSERAIPGFYAVNLLDDDIDVSLTASERVGWHKYHFNQNQNKHVVLDLQHRDEVIQSSLKIEDSFTVSGLRRSKAWAENQYVFFVIKFSQPFFSAQISSNNKMVDVAEIPDSKDIKASFSFDVLENNDLYVKVALSSVSVEGAKKNLWAEANALRFDDVVKHAENKWNEELSKIEVTSSDKDKLTVFYTALYHTAIVPNINMDVDGNYRGRDNQIHKAEGFTYYSVFSLWDTYRAAHPLYSIIDQKRTLDYIKTFLVQYEQSGRLPVWELSSCETDCMIGFHSVPVILDAYRKGIRDFNTSLALKAMMDASSRSVLGLPAFNSKGLINVEDDHESVSKTLEYAFDDYCIASFAKHTGHYDIANDYFNRSKYYRNLFDPSTGFMRPRKNGDWIAPFDPTEVNNHYTEANSWQYSFYFPHDVNGYLNMSGGKNKLEEKLDQMFSADSKTTGREQSDITGLIGQYAHGNEPSHHIAYLYNYTKSPHKAQYLINKILNEFYTNKPDGLIGNEDCGQMSAWYVLSAIGFYPVNPSNNQFLWGSPQFENVILKSDKGFQIKLSSTGTESNHCYIKSLFVKDRTTNKISQWTKPNIDFEDLSKYSDITIAMDSIPSNSFRDEVVDTTHSVDKEFAIVLNPVIHANGMTFHKKMQINISSPQKNCSIFYTIDGSEPTASGKLYTKPFQIRSSSLIKAIAIDAFGNNSYVTQANFKKLVNAWDVKLNTSYMKSYDGGGASGLVDQVYGQINWRMGNWQGYQNQGLDAVVDLKKIERISEVNITFLQDTRSWVVMPKSVSIELSEDGKQFHKVYEASNFFDIKDLNVQVKKVAATFNAEKVRYVRVTAEQYGKLPEWHQGAGGESIIFVDEIEVK